MKTPARLSNHAGFTLIEIAIALFIVTLLLGAILMPLQTQVENRNIRETQQTLDIANEALIGYAAANGRFPCPASAASNGTESFDAGGNAANGKCANFLDGYLPAVTLGLTSVDAQGYAVDAWHNRIRYAVSDKTINGQSDALTRTGGMRNATMASISNALLLYVCASGTGVAASTCGTATTLITNAPAVIWSLGANAQNTGMFADASTDEKENQDNDNVFVWHTPSQREGAEFDDLVVWISPNTLFNRLIAAGQLP